MEMMLSSATVQLDTEINNKHKTLIAAILQNFFLDANYYYVFSKSIESTKKNCAFPVYVIYTFDIAVVLTSSQIVLDGFIFTIYLSSQSCVKLTSGMMHW